MRYPMLLGVALLLAALYIYLGRYKPRLALITAPAACGLLVYLTTWAGSEFDTFQALLLAPMILLAALMSLALSPAEPAIKQWPRRWARFLLLGFAALLVAATALIAMVTLPSFGFLSLLLFILITALVGAAINYGLTSRQSHAAYVVSTIGSCMRQNLPLVMALESAAGAADDRRSRILRSINYWLVRGFGVAHSLEMGCPQLPADVLATISAAERINQLPQAFESLQADMVARSEQSKRIEPVHPYYPLVLVMLAGFIIWGILTFILPQIVMVMTDMSPESELPGATRALISVFRFVGYGDGVLFIAALALLLLVVLPLSVYLRFRRRRPDQPYMLSRLGDFIKWHLPVLHWFEKNRAMVQTTELLRLWLNAGGTVNDAIAQTLQLDMNNSFRSKLRRWHRMVEAGRDISDAAKAAGVGNALAWAFDQKLNQGNTLEILQSLETLHRSNYSYRANLARFIICPCVNLVMGLIVGFVVYAIWSAPVAMIQYTVDAIYP